MPPIASSLTRGALRTFEEVDAAGDNSRQLTGRWWCASTVPNAAKSPTEFCAMLRAGSVVARPMTGPVTIASALAASGTFDDDAPPDFDGQDWWTWCETEDIGSVSRPMALVFEGLASIVDVWWNEQPLGRADNMFVPWHVLVDVQQTPNTLYCCSRAMTPLLQPRRPRARWRSRLLESQEWRWHRTTHLGRMPGVGPRVPPVGVWQPIALMPVSAPIASSVSLVPTRSHETSQLSVEVHGYSTRVVERATLECGGEAHTLEVTSTVDGFRVWGTLASERFEAWWPHTHGAPITYATRLRLVIAGQAFVLELGDVGFRELAIDDAGDAFAITINNHALFLRGTCWVPADWTRLDTIDAQFEADLPLLVAAGLNCVRFSGCFTYATPRMLAACDRAGLAVWQDLMFSVLDYPHEDAEFISACTSEAALLAQRAQRHACVLVLCGNSEVEQQASMMGIATSEVAHPLFREHLANAVHTAAPALHYWPGTPSGGALPTQLSAGTAHYFGVGAYLRALDDARRAEVRFATECLAFANLAEPDSPSAICLPFGGAITQARQQWHVHVPKDGGASWDFADVRDHYAGRFFKLSDKWFLSSDAEQYAAFGRVASYIAIERTMQEFRRPGSTTQGALTWLWRDPWRGAGWGMVDYDGYPKSAWYAARRASRPTALALTNEGLDGVYAHLRNDRPIAVRGRLTARLLRADGTVVARGEDVVTVAARSALTVRCDAVFDRMTDSTHAFRFGPRAHDVVHVAWTSIEASTDPHGAMHAMFIGTFEGKPLLDDATMFVDAELPERANVDDLSKWEGNAERESDGRIRVTLTSEAVVPFVRLGCAGVIFDDAYFTLAPGVRRVVHGDPRSTVDTTEISVDPLSFASCAPRKIPIDGPFS